MSALRPKLLFVLIVASTIFVACGKYEDGPNISIRSVEGRLEGKYKVVEFTKNDIDLTQAWVDTFNWEFEFVPHYYTSNGTWADNYFEVSGKFYKDNEWQSLYIFSAFELLNNDLELSIGLSFYYNTTPANYFLNDVGIFPLVTGPSRTFEIRRLTYNELWLKYLYGTDVYFIKMEE